GKHAGLIKQVAQRNTFPHGIANQARVQTVANAHESGLLRRRFESYKILKSPGCGVLHEAADFQVPQVDVHLGIDDVLSDTVEQVVRRNRLNDVAFVLGAVVAERSRAIQFARQRSSATSRREANSAQHECAASDSGSELIILRIYFFRGQKSEACYQRSFE